MCIWKADYKREAGLTSLEVRGKRFYSESIDGDMTCLTTEDFTGLTEIAVLATVTGVAVSTSYNSSSCLVRSLSKFR